MGRYFQLKIYVTYRPTSLCCCILRDTWKRDQTVQKLEFLKSWQKTTIWNALYSGGYFCLLLNVNSEFGRFFFSLIFYRLQGINFSDTFFNIIKYLKIVRKCSFFFCLYSMIFHVHVYGLPVLFVRMAVNGTVVHVSRIIPYVAPHS